MSPLNHAKKLIADGKAAEALPILIDLASNEPGNRFALYELGKLHKAAGKYTEAIASLRSVIQVKADWAGARAVLGECLLLSGNQQEARLQYGESLRAWNGPDRQEYVRFFYTTCDRILSVAPTSDKPERLLHIVDHLCAVDEELNSTTPWGSLYRAFTCFARGDFEAAVGYFQQVPPRGDYQMGRHSSGAQSMRSRAHVAAVEGLPRTEYSDFQWFQRSFFGSSDYVIVISSDSRYFQQYTLLSARSIMENTSACLHLNVVNPSNDDYQSLVALAGDYPGRIASTVQRFTGRNAKCFYACSRFLILPDLLREYDRPIITLDADSAIIAPIPVDQMRSADFCYKSAKSIGLSHYPWRAVAAGIVFFNTTEAGHRIARLLRNFIASVLKSDADSGDYWYIDQSAMVCVLAAIGDGININDLGSATGQYCVFPDARTETKDEFVSRMSA